MQGPDAEPAQAPTPGHPPGRDRMLRRPVLMAASAVAALSLLLGLHTLGRAQPAGATSPGATARPALTVKAVTPQRADWPSTLVAHGGIAAWQEVIIGPEVGGYRLAEVRAQVGDRVRKGQLLARIGSETIAAELAQTRAAAAEAAAQLEEARLNARRARELSETGALSSQQVQQYLTAEQTAVARLDSAQARVRADELRLSHTRVVAPDDGVISARQATVGSLAQQGQELFRMIRNDRLEWRAEVTATELARIQPGMAVQLTVPGAEDRPVSGLVRAVAPTIDPQTRNAMVYVDLPPGSPARAGMFARGELVLGSRAALSLPQSAVLLRDGFAYVFVVGADQRVTQTKVSTGRRQGDRIEVLQGLGPQDRVVAGSVAFLADGDLVKLGS